LWKISRYSKIAFAGSTRVSSPRDTQDEEMHVVRAGIARVGLALAGLFLASACTEVAPRVTRAPSYPLDLAPVYVTAAPPEYKEAVLSALERADIPVTTGRDDVGFMLRARIGNGQGFGGDCGRLHNVRWLVDYALDPRGRTASINRQTVRGPRALRIKAKGHVGDCSPNVFDEMATLLSSHMIRP
jgi:hypothetical protein